MHRSIIFPARNRMTQAQSGASNHSKQSSVRAAKFAALLLLSCAPASLLHAQEQQPDAQAAVSDSHLVQAPGAQAEEAKPEEAKVGEVTREDTSSPALPAAASDPSGESEAAGIDHAISDTPSAAGDTTGSIHGGSEPLDPNFASKPSAPDAATPSAAQSDPAQTPLPAATQAAESKPAPEKPAISAVLRGALETLVFTEAKGAHAADTQKTREALAAFYTLHDFAPLWSVDGKATAAARAVIDRLQHAPDDGLDLILLPDLQAGSDEERVKADLALSQAIIAYGRAASGERIDPKTISPLIGAKPEVAEPFDILAAVAGAGDTAGNVLWAFNPPQKGYQALRAKLAEMRHENPAVARTHIPSGPDLTVGMRDPRVTLIRARFGLDAQASPAPENLIYDTRVAAAVADFQKTKGLPASGVLTARTIAALSGGQPSRLENEILANMERWRWMPRDMGETYIAVNIPDFMVSVVHGDDVLTRHRVVVGKPETPTPVFSNKMQYLIVNPYWNVPQSIIRKEFLPKAGGDLSYLNGMGWQVSSHNGQLVVRQQPGERNALGRIKFLFPNDYSVYLHDTPSKALFASAKRAFSHGCVRVDQPFGFAEVVLNHSWSEQRLKTLIGEKERYINLPVALPIHIEYFTTYVDETGRLQMRDDVYGYSHKVKAALGLEG